MHACISCIPCVLGYSRSNADQQIYVKACFHAVVLASSDLPFLYRHIIFASTSATASFVFLCLLILGTWLKHAGLINVINHITYKQLCWQTFSSTWVPTIKSFAPAVLFHLLCRYLLLAVWTSPHALCDLWSFGFCKHNRTIEAKFLLIILLCRHIHISACNGWTINRFVFLVSPWSRAVQFAEPMFVFWCLVDWFFDVFELG